MGLAFDLEVMPSRHVARWRVGAFGCAAAGLLLAGARLLAGPTTWWPQGGWAAAGVGAALVLAGCAALVAAWRETRGPARAVGRGVRLRVDGRGDAWLAQPRELQERPVRPVHAHPLPGLIALRVAPYPGSPPDARGSAAAATTLLFGRDAVPDDTWRRLNVWLNWMDRGRQVPPDR